MISASSERDLSGLQETLSRDSHRACPVGTSSEEVSDAPAWFFSVTSDQRERYKRSRAVSGVHSDSEPGGIFTDLYSTCETMATECGVCLEPYEMDAT